MDRINEYAWAEEKWKSNGDDSPIGFFGSIKETVMHTTTRVLIVSRDKSDIRYGFRTTWIGESNQGFKGSSVRRGRISFTSKLWLLKMTVSGDLLMMTEDWTASISNTLNPILFNYTSGNCFALKSVQVDYKSICFL